MPTRLSRALRRGSPVLTVAGARVQLVSPSVAAAFLARLPTHEAAWTDEIDVAVGSMTDSGELVGVAVLSPPDGERAAGFVAVAPGRRRLGLGADLLLVLLSEAASRELRAVTCADGPASASWKLLCRSLGLEPIMFWRQGTATLEIPVRDRALFSRPQSSSTAT